MRALIPEHRACVLSGVAYAAVVAVKPTQSRPAAFNHHDQRVLPERKQGAAAAGPSKGLFTRAVQNPENPHRIP